MDRERIERAVKEILIGIGENPEREGLKDTPRRVADMYTEIFAGLKASPEGEITLFKDDYAGMIVVKDIPFYSMCEHHLVPFFGKADIVYLPNQGNILGLSKIVRIVDMLAKKPQLQERLTDEIACQIMEISSCEGVLARLEAEHLCMTMRGVKKPGTKIITLSAKGSFAGQEQLRKEALQLCL